VDGRRVRLSPGMNLTAEIKTGQRRVIEFLLSPVVKAGRESLRER
jgi:hemolysin D